jgi:pilus assembly protein CpaB
MAKTRAVMMITLSLGLGVTAAWMAGNWVRQTNSTAEVSLATVVAAEIGVPFGTKVAERHLKILTMPAEFVPPGSFSTIEEVVDRVTVQPIVAGEILMRERFAESDDGSTLAALVSEKMRAVTVRVDDVIGVAGFLLPGNRVDVLAARRESGQRATAETILRDVKVLAVDQTAATEKNEPVIVRAVTLEVNPQQAEVLVKAKEEGSIQLTLRNPLDDEVLVETPPPPPAPVVAAPVRVARPAAPPPRRAVTVIRGTDVSQVREQS